MSGRYKTTFSIIAIIVVCIIIGVGIVAEPTSASQSDEIIVEESESVQEAIENATAGTTIILQAGTHSESVIVDTEEVVLTGESGAELEGDIDIAASGVTIDSIDIVGSFTGIDTESHVNSLSITDLTISSPSSSGVSISAEEVEIEGVTIESPSDDALVINSGSSGNIAIEDTEIKDVDGGVGEPSWGINIEGGDEIILSGISMSNTHSTGIRFASDGSSNQDITIENSELTNTGGSAVYNSDVASSVEIENVDVENSDSYGFRLQAADDIAISDVTIDGTSNTGIDIDFDSTGSITIENTEISNVDGDPGEPSWGIDIEDGEEIILSDIDISNTYSTGISISPDDASDPEITIENSDLTNIGTSGIFISDDPSSVNIQNVDIEDTDSYGMSIDAEDEVVIADVSIDDTSDTGIEIDFDGIGSITIENTEISNVDGDPGEPSWGIDIEDGEEIILSDIDISNTYSTGISISPDDASDPEITIENSDLTNIGTSGIFISDDPSSVNIQNVDIEDTDSYGMSIDAEDEVVIADVSIDDTSDTGIDIDGDTDLEISIKDISIVDAGNSGISVLEGNSVTIDQADLRFTEGQGIVFEQPEARDRTITVRDITMVENGGGAGLRIQSTSGEQFISLDNIEIIDDSGNGLNIEAEEIIAENINIDGTGHTAITADLSREGHLTLSNVDIENSDESGLSVTEGRDIDVSNLNVDFVEGHTISFTTEDARGQNIVLDEIQAVESDGSGIYVGGSSGTDSVSITDSIVTRSATHGYALDNVEEVRLERVIAEDSGENDLWLGVIDREEATIIDSFDGSDVEDGSASDTDDGSISDSDDDSASDTEVEDTDDEDGSLLPISFGQLVALLFLGGGAKYVYGSVRADGGSAGKTSNSKTVSGTQKSSSSGGNSSSSNSGNTPGTNPGKPSISDNQSGAAYSGSTQIVDPVDPDSSSNSDNSDTKSLVDPSQPESSSSNTTIDLVDPDDDDAANGDDQKDGNQ